MADGQFPCFPVGMFFLTSFFFCFDAEVSEEIKQQAAERALQIHLPSKEKGKGFRQWSGSASFWASRSWIRIRIR